MRAGWKVKPLGELCDVLDRLRRPITKSDRKAGPYPYYGATGILDHVEGYLFDEPLVLVGEDGAKWEAGAQSAFSISGKTWVNNHAHVLRPYRNEIDDDWLVFYLNANDLLPFVSGMTVPKLNQARLREIPIIVPPLHEQRRLVVILDEAFEGLNRARAHAEANLRNATELFSEAEADCFRKLPDSTTKTTLGNLATFRNGLNYSRSSRGAEVKVVGVGDFRDNFAVPLETIGSARIDGTLNDEDLLQKGDILAVRSNGNPELVGRTMLVPQMSEPVSYSGFTIRIRPSFKKISSEYLCSFMRTKAARIHLAAGGGGTNISNLNQRILSSFPVALPTLDVQHSILAKLETLRSNTISVRVRYEEKSKDISDLRQALLHRAFAGQLT